MAELGLAIAGLVVAWKGITDFVHVVNELGQDDKEQRKALSRRFRTSRMMLEEWFGYWGIDRDSGPFHNLKPDRQEMVRELIEQLQTTTAEAARILDEKHESVEAAKGPSKSPKRGLAKYSAKVTTAVRRGGEKAQWLIAHQATIESLIKEMEAVWRDLNGIASATDDLIRILAANTPRLKPRMTFIAAVDQVMESVRTSRVAAISHQDSPHVGSNISVDQVTLVGLATRTLSSSRQVELVQRSLEVAFDDLGDARVVHHVTEWWNDARSNVMLLETTDEPGDQSSTSACVLLYFHVDCQKLLYVFENDSTVSQSQQILDMVRTLSQSLFISRKPHLPLDKASQASVRLLLDEDAICTAGLSGLVPAIVQLLQEAVDNSEKRVVLILAGLDLLNLAEQSESTLFMQLFLQSLNEFCEGKVGSKPASFKALLSCKGYASTLYNSGDFVDTVDLTDQSLRDASFGEWMASSLNG
jgi:hypothetical protein